MRDHFILAFKNLKKRRVRSWLTILGIFIGITAVVAIISLGQGFQKAVENQFSSIGGDKIFIQPRGQFGPPGSTTIGAQLTKEDVNVVRKIAGIEAVSYFVAGNAQLRFNEKLRFSMAGGIPLDKNSKVLEEFYKIDAGRFLKMGDRRKALIGSLYHADSVFGKPLQIRDTLLIQGEKFEVVGILKSIGNPGDDSIVLISEEDLRELFSTADRVDNIVVKAADTEKAAEQIKNALRKSRNVKKGKEDFFLLTPEELLSTFQNVFGVIQVFIIGIAAISLIVGGIGIMNTMYTSVLERTKEIGIMKAIGARNRDVLLIFLIESGLLGFVGGLIGVGVGMFIAQVAAYVVEHAFATTLLQAFFPWYLIIGSLFFSFFIGALSGVFPAFQASRLKPVEALRYE